MDIDSGDEAKTGSNWAEVGRSGGSDNDGFLYDRIASGESGEPSGSSSAAGSSKKKANVLDDEPDLAKSGLAAALQMARNKGYIEANEEKATGLGLKHLQVMIVSVVVSTPNALYFSFTILQNLFYLIVFLHSPRTT